MVNISGIREDNRYEVNVSFADPFPGPGEGFNQLREGFLRRSDAFVMSFCFASLSLLVTWSIFFSFAYTSAVIS